MQQLVESRLIILYINFITSRKKLFSVHVKILKILFCSLYILQLIFKLLIKVTNKKYLILFSFFISHIFFVFHIFLASRCILHSAGRQRERGRLLLRHSVTIKQFCAPISAQLPRHCLLDGGTNHRALPLLERRNKNNSFPPVGIEFLQVWSSHRDTAGSNDI